MAAQALQLSNQSDYPEGKIRAPLLLGDICITTGRFAGDTSYYPQAQEYLHLAKTNNAEVSDNGWSIEIALAYSRLYQEEKDYDEALVWAEQALRASEQKQNTDSLIRTLCSISSLLILKNKLFEAQEYARRGLRLLNDEMSESLRAEVYYQLCQVHIKRQEYSQTLEYSEAILEISRRYQDVEKELTALNNIAIYYANISDYKTAMQYFLEALEKSKRINYRAYIAQSQINIATIYASLFNYREATKRYQSVLNDYSDVLDNYRKVILYNNLGNNFYLIDEPEEAVKHFQRALDLAERINYREMIAHILAQQSRCVAALKMPDQALQLAQQAQKLIDELGDINGKQINLINLGNIYYERKAYDQAIRLTSQGIVAAKRMNDEQHEIRGYQLLAKIYQDLGDFEQALSYQLIYSNNQEKFAQTQRSRQILDQEIQFAIREKQKEIEQLTRENEYQALLLKQSDRIANQNAQLLQVNEELRQFAYVASHDLKEPLRMIRSYTQLIERKFLGETGKEEEQYFNFVNEGVVRMNNLLDALLKYATIGKSEEDKEQVKLIDVVDIAIINLRVSIEENRATINCDNLPVVQSIQSLLVQLFQNLISNAIKFRKKDIDPEIIISYEEGPEEFILRVKDNGIGIAPEFKDRIFVIFQRLHTRIQYEGTGIGLAICQKIVQRLGGTIWVESEVGQGATFCFTIPK